MERLKDYQEQAQRPLSPEDFYALSPAEQEADKIAQKVSNATKDASKIVQVDFGNIQVKNLETGVAGQQDMTKPSLATGTSLDEGFLENASEDDIRQVILHENIHRGSAQNSNGERVEDLAWEEAITEIEAAKQNNSTPQTYHNYIRQFRSEVARISSTEDELIRAYKEGRIIDINEAFEEAQEKKVA